MTTYSMTDAQRDEHITALKEVDALLSKLNQPRHRGLEAAIAMLQSLPMASAEPLAWFENEGFMPDVGNKKVDLNWGDGTFSNRVIANQFPWHKLFSPCIVEWRYSDKPSPQPLQPITADDVSDKTIIDLWRIGVLTSTGTQGKEIAMKVYNAVIKNRSEAR